MKLKLWPGTLRSDVNDYITSTKSVQWKVITGSLQCCEVIEWHEGVPYILYIKGLCKVSLTRRNSEWPSWL